MVLSPIISKKVLWKSYREDKLRIAKGIKVAGILVETLRFCYLPVWILIWRFHVDLSYRVLLQIGHSLRSLGLPMPAEATFCM
jgi:hypothetical protein